MGKEKVTLFNYTTLYFFRLALFRVKVPLLQGKMLCHKVFQRSCKINTTRTSVQ